MEEEHEKTTQEAAHRQSGSRSAKHGTGNSNKEEETKCTREIQGKEENKMEAVALGVARRRACSAATRSKRGGGKQNHKREGGARRATMEEERGKKT